MFLVVRTPRQTVGPVWQNLGDIKERLERLESSLPVYFGNQLDWDYSGNWRLDKPFGFLVVKPSGARFAEVSFRNDLVTWGYMAGIGFRIRFLWVMYSWGRAQWRFEIFSVGLQMAIKLNRVESSWIELNRVESSWIELNRVESSWIELNRVGSSWIELDRVGSSSIQLHPAPSSSIQLHPAPSSSIQLHPAPSSSIQLHPAPSSSIQLHPAPSSSIQLHPAPSSSIQLHPAPSSSIQLHPAPSSSIQLDWAGSSWIELNQVKCVRRCVHLCMVMCTAAYTRRVHHRLSVQLIHAQQAGMEWHEDLQNLAQQSGLKGKKLNKVRGKRSLFFLPSSTLSTPPPSLSLTYRTSLSSRD